MVFNRKKYYLRIRNDCIIHFISLIGIESSVSVLASANTQYIIQNLEPENEYGIWVKALSLTREGPRSEIVTGRPTDNGNWKRFKSNFNRKIFIFNFIDRER